MDNRVGIPAGNSTTANIGYIIVPSDVDREAFLQKCLRLSRVSILSIDNQVYHDCPCNPDIITSLTFPILPGELGSGILFNKIKNHGTPVVVCKIPKNDDIYGDKQLDKIGFSKETAKGFVSASMGAEHPHLFLELKSKVGASVVKIKLSGADSRFDVENVQGTLNLLLKQFAIVCFDSLSIEVGENDSKSTITITEGDIKINSTKIVLGNEDTAQQTVLGEDLIRELQTLSQRVSVLFEAIKAAPITPSDGGASFKSALVAAISSTLTEQIGTTLLSRINYTQ